MWGKFLGWVAAILAYRAGQSAGQADAHNAAVARQASIAVAIAEARAGAPTDRDGTERVLDEAKF